MTEEGRRHGIGSPSSFADLARSASALARDHQAREEPPEPLPAIASLEATATYFSALRPRLAARGDLGEDRTVEWFLDNEFLLHRAVRQIAEDLPAGFYHRLPALTDGRPRIHDLARALLRASGLRLDRAELVRFLCAYQEVTTLRTAELWALPTMLRAVALARIVGCLTEIEDEGAAGRRIEGGLARPFDPGPPPEDEILERGEACGRSIRLLREISAIRWDEVFGEVSALERVLGEDPAGAYSGMDDDTRDLYRSVVEEIAWGTGQEETAVARRAVERAAQQSDGPPRQRHVGHWLVGSGRREFDESLGYRPPFGARVQRWLTARPARSYIGGVLTTMAILWCLPTVYLWRAASGPWVWGLGALLLLLPASVLAVTAVQWTLTQLLPPRILPKMDFSRGIPDEYRTMVVIPTLLGSQDEIQALVRQLEKHHLSNPDPSLEFAILGDLTDAPEEHMPEDDALVASVEAGVLLLNEKYGSDGSGPFHFFLRKRKWNPSEGCWMAWERKRGKLEEFNSLLVGEDQGSYVRHVGREQGLDGVRFVITLDSDTVLPHGCAARLVGIMAHPLNEALFDESSGRVVEGYTVVQPRVDVSPASTDRTRFSRIFAGDTGIDIYSRAVSDVYQDLSGTGSFIGKGIYDVRSFRRSLEGRVPENTLLSHDLFEGIHGRAGLATDVVLFEDYPTLYLSFARRLHRWIRGDWQILPWLRRRAPLGDGTRGPNRLTLLDRWKILDNLRRSLVGPAMLALVVAGWLVLPGSPWAWTAFALIVPAGHILAELVTGLAHARPRSRVVLARMGRALPENLGRWLLFWAFLPHETTLVLDAVLRTLHRIFVSRRRMLEWQTAAHTDRLLVRTGRRAAVWLEMASAPLLALALIAALAVWRPTALGAAAPLLALWLAAPEIALFLSRPASRRAVELSQAERRELRRLARRTWLFFETFVGPEDQWLPPDNFQERPRGEVAHRTSPTNVGMMLVSCLSAHQLGYLTLTDLVFRLRNALESMARLEHYRGHLLNWYDTRDLRPLEPRYVSTVDSGNLAGDLLVVQQGCAEIAGGQVLHPELWLGLRDSLEQLAELALRIAREVDDQGPWRIVVERVSRTARGLRPVDGDLLDWAQNLHEVCDVQCAEIDEALVTALRDSETFPDRGLLRELRSWVDDVHDQLRNMRREVEELLPWIEALLEPPTLLAETPADSEVGRAWERLATGLRRRPRLDEIPHQCLLITSALEELERALGADTGPERVEFEGWSRDLCKALREGAANARSLHEELLGIGARAEDEAMGMDFSLLYDEDRHLFRIGLNVSAGRPDPNHYDLLASEARLASFLAIAKGDVPQRHWFVLGRPATRVEGRLALLSWGATAFEYLMPTLLMRSGPETLLSRSCRVSVDRQISYGQLRGVPWGISEAGYHHFDPDRNYQYRSFGVPGLGFKRGLAEDLVVAPYASLLALSVRPREVMDNLQHLDELRAFGRYGLYESLDFTSARLPPGRRYAIVRSYMAHHQGMILSSIANYLGGGTLARLFHANSIVQTAEMLLNEQVPPNLPTEVVRTDAQLQRAKAPPSLDPTTRPWTPRPNAAWPEAYALSNGSLTSVLTDSGGGYLARDGIALTRFAADPTRDDCGHWVYVRDEDTGDFWSVGRNPTGVVAEESQVVFYAHQVELHRRDRGISLGMEVCVTPDVDVELRRVTLRNESGQPRRLSIFGYAEVSLSPPAQAARHPAFDKLFVETTFEAEEGTLIFSRRPRTSGESSPVLAHRMVFDGRSVRRTGYETDRERFLGRMGSLRRPRAVESGGDLGEGRTGAVLDPVLALQATVVLPPHGRAQLAFVTAGAASRADALRFVQRFATFHAIDEAFEHARTDAARDLSQIELPPDALPTVQRLLSILVFPRPGLRTAGEALASERFGKPDLWSHGISGDVPIVALRLRDSAEVSLLEELLRAHRLLRGRGVHFDLVVLREGSSGYEDDVQDRLQRLIENAGAQSWMNRPGGVFLVRCDQVASEERAVVAAAARVVLDSSRGSLIQQLEAGRRAVQDLPPFIPQLAGRSTAEPTPILEHEQGLSFANPWGGFTADGSEYVIHLEPGRPTPAPWCNVLANVSFGCLVSEAGLGYTWSVNAGEFRLTPWSDDPVLDEPSEALFLRDEETGAIWSTTPLPSPGEGDYQVRHGIGSTRWRHHSNGLLQETEVFIAPEEPLKFVRLRLCNVWGRPRRLTATYYAEWVLGTTREESFSHVVPWYDPTAPALFARSSWNPDFAERVVFLVADRDTHGFTADRREFLGREGNRGFPAALGRWGLAGSAEPGGDPCAALQVHLELDVGQEIEAVFVLGGGANREEAWTRARRARMPGAVDRARRRMNHFWEGVLGAVQVRTPDPSFDVLINRWLPYQVLASRFLGRTGFYQSSGAYGFRDQLQDSLGLVYSRPDLIRAHLLEAARRQFEAGDALHWWHPPGGSGVRTRCSDDYLWLVYVTAHYVRTTGDDSVLAEQVPFLVADPLGPEESDRYARFDTSEETGDLFEHCRRALENAAPRGAHGLPLMGDGDWNDGMNRVGAEGRGESVWLAWFLCSCYEAFAGLCERRGLPSDADRWREESRELARRVEAEGWDGSWYRRAYDDEGRPLGSTESAECKIDSIAQSWSVLSGAGDPQRAALALAAAREHLVRDDERIVLLLTPPFDRGPQNPGYIRGYPPGVRENGGQYTHAAAWLGWAFAGRGDGDTAGHIFQLINPLLRTSNEEDCRRYRVEPYVLAADVYGAEPHVGRGGWTWYTGAASWIWRLGVEAILGLRLVDGDLEVEPCLPESWDGFEATLRTPGGPCRIRVQRVEGSPTPRITAELNGTSIDGPRIPIRSFQEPRTGSPARR